MQADIDLRIQKKSLRREVLAERQALESIEVAAKSQVINEYLDTLSPLASARVIMGYAPFRNEVDIMPWLLKRIEAGVTVLLPRVVPGTGDLEAVPLAPDEQMETSKMGLSEPMGAAADPAVIEAIIIPGVVFDRRGYRLGYGKGYYDRFLPQLKPQAFCCAVAYDLQVVDEVPFQNHDYRLSYLVTESGVYQW